MKKYFLLLCINLIFSCVLAQNEQILTAPHLEATVDSMPTKQGEATTFSSRTDTFFLKKKAFTPRGATLRSLILPGWGQLYNKQYWKIPIAIAAVGIPIGIFIDNHSFYKQSAYAAKMGYQLYKDPSNTAGIEHLSPIWTEYYEKIKTRYNAGEILLTEATHQRNTFRKYQDYALLWTLIMWGLNVADATVAAHLKSFDVSDNLSLRIQPTIRTQLLQPEVQFIFTIK